MEPRIRAARPDDAAALNRALAQLSAHLGDTHKARAEDIAHGLFGPTPVARARLAEDEAGALCGVTIYSPVFSTRYGTPGVFVSDLWVSETRRGQGLARRLLQATMSDAVDAWGATFLKLTVANDNRAAWAFYDRLGFRPADTETNMFIDADRLSGEEETT